MIDELRAMALFAETIKQGSFRGAAKVLNLSPSVVSYQISQLEQRLGSALIYRSTRKLSLTHEGEVLYTHALQMLDCAQQGLSKVTANAQELTGKLTITLLAALIRSPLNQQIARFCQLHPKLKINIIYTDTTQDLIANGIDLAIRSGELPDSSLKARRIGQIERKLVCSKDYLAKQTKPNHPQDLVSWQWVKLSMLPAARTLVKPGHEPQLVQFDSNVSVNSVEAMHQMTVFGLGVSTPSDFLVEAGLNDGSLVELLPDWQVPPVPLHAIWPANVAQGSNARRLLEFLVAL